MGQDFTQTLGGLATCRALMGFFESGFVPGNLVGLWKRRVSDSSFRLSVPDWVFGIPSLSVPPLLLAHLVEDGTYETVL